MKKQKLKQKSSESFNEPIRLLIGTCPGNKKDAEDMARGWIDKFFEIPSRSWIYLHAGDDIGVHFEIHEGGDGKPLLPSILKASRESSQLFIRTLSKRMTQVNRREDGSFQSLVLTESSTEGVEESAGIYATKKKMIPYVTTGSEWIKVGLTVMVLGLLTVTTSGAVSKGYDLAVQGYAEVASTLPSSRLAELVGLTKEPIDMVYEYHELPISQWPKLVSQKLGPIEYIGKLEFKSGNWKITKGSPAPESIVPDLNQTPAGTNIPTSVEAVEGRIENDQ